MVRTIIINILVLFALFAPVELASRVYGYFFVAKEQAFSWRNYSVAENVNLIEGPMYPAVPEPILGFLPKPGRYDDWKGETLTILKDGTRSNGSLSTNQRPVVLAVGDSFTFGDQVSDDQTWPAVLERMIQGRVVNAGVFGYGIDQSYLLAQRIMRRMTPELLIVGMIPDNIERAELRARMGVAKPSFHISGDDLVLTSAVKNAALIDTPSLRVEEKVVAVARKVLGYSFLLHQILHRAFPEAWRSERFSIAAHDDGVAVSCMIMQRIAAFEVPRKVLFVQYPAHLIIAGRQSKRIQEVMRCARQSGIEVVDMYNHLRAHLAEDKLAFTGLYKGHMSAVGNRFATDVLVNESRHLQGLMR